MQKFKHIIYCLGALLFLNVAFAHAQQDTSKNTDPSLNGQYQFMLKKSKSLYGARLINPARLSGVWKSVNDTLRKERKQLADARQQIKTQADNIASLKGEVTGKETSLASATASVNEISFLGIPFNKGTYNTIVWAIIIILAAALAIVILQTGKFRKEATYRTQLYQEVADEFQAHKVKAKDKEMRLARELQDERNKWDDAGRR
ncbi:BAR domain-containing protein [Pedobacter jamesrossensis]|uniref:30S ribosomal protein S10 n=1 Tax=Pedobacter jamesrossensis TaxID=1908238 RepID=A0ABV8NRA5_9SPHI